jgi:hypothetical protein
VTWAGWLPDETKVRITSGQCDEYNCLGWCVDHDETTAEAFWPPGKDPVTTAATKWPEHLPVDDTRVETFALFLADYGYSIAPETEDGRPDESYDKIVMYMKNGKPSHFAWQREDGCWGSKLGGLTDVLHADPADATCYEFGSVARFFLKARPADPDLAGTGNTGDVAHR